MTEWQPEFPGQRPPFAPGHEQAMVHGAYSERKVGPLAAEIEADARAAEGWPEYLEAALFGPAVKAWARAEAVVSLLWAWLAEQDITSALADTVTEDSEEQHSKSRSTRRMVSRRTASVLETWRKAEAAARTHRQSLGLDPGSQARIGRDLTASRYMSGLSSPLVVALDRLEADRAVEAGDTGE